MDSKTAPQRTLTSLFTQVCEKKPNQEIMVTYSEDMKRRSLTRREFYSLASKFAYILKQRGLKRGDVMTNTLPVSLEAAVVLFGAILAGGGVVTVDVVTQSAEELFHAINKAQSKIVVTRSDFKDHGWEALSNGIKKSDNFFVKDFAMPRTDSVNTAIVANRDNTDDGGDDFLSFLAKQTETFVDLGVQETDKAFIFLTSGTTGFPKLAVHSHGSIVTDVVNGEEALIVRDPPGYYIATSWSWIVSSPGDILWGLTRVTADFWHPLKDLFKLSAKILKQENVRMAFLSPLFVDKVAKNWETQDNIFDQLFVGGMPIDKIMCDRLLELAHVVTIRYGQSENLNIAYNHIVSSRTFYSHDTGRPYKGTNIRVVDDNMEDVAPGDPGRILVKTGNNFKEYLNDPEKTAKSLTPDGWYNSSDAGYLRPQNGNIVVIGRYDYVIFHKSVHLYPSWIEKPIKQHPYVAEALVVPVPDETNYHNICACVILKPGHPMTSKDIQNIVKNYPTTDSKHIVPPQYVLFYDAFPTNARGKVVMNKLIEDAIQKVKKQNIIAKEVQMG